MEPISLPGKRPDGALLAGGCAGLAGALGWNVWAIRVLFLGFAALKTLPAIAAYAVLSLIFHVGGNSTQRNGEADIASPELSQRKSRIEDLERRFRDLENSARRN